MSRPLRIGVIGAGANTRARHLPGFRRIPGVAVVAVGNRSRASAEQVAREFAIPRVAESWREIIEAPDIDAVCIGTWPNLHAKLTVAALRAGKHVLTEARMARNLAEAEQMQAEARQRPELVAQLVPAPMSLPFDATVRALLADGTLGAVREAGMTCTGDSAADAGRPLTWRQDAALSGRNTLFLGIYYEMLRRWLDADPLSVVAEAAVFTPERAHAGGGMAPVVIPESVTVLGRFAARPADAGRVELAAGARLIGHFSGVETSGPRAELRLNGSAAGLRLDLARGELWLGRPGAPEQLVETAADRADGWNVEVDFVDSIREGWPVRLTDFATGVRYMAFTEAVWESWQAAGARAAVPASV